jgi:hypothetical protein
MYGGGRELIDQEQEEIRKLSKSFQLRESRVLRGGFSHYWVGDNGGRPVPNATIGHEWIVSKQHGGERSCLARCFSKRMTEVDVA